MYRLATVVTSFCFLLSATGVFAEASLVAASDDAIIEGVVLIKLNEPATATIEATTSARGVVEQKTAGGVPLTGIASLDALGEEYNAVRMERVFRPADKNEARHREFGLHRWYRVTFAETSLAQDVRGVREAVAAYAAASGVGIAEATYEKSFSDGYEPRKMMRRVVKPDAVRVAGTVAVVNNNFAYSTLAKNATFEGLGDLEDSNFQSFAYGVSADGSVVVGQGESANGPEAFRWEGGIMEGLGDLEGGSFQSSALEVSADGAVVVGNGASDAFLEAFRWEGGTMEGLGHLEGGDFLLSQGVAISSDGAVIVGSSTSENGSEAFRWENGTMEGLGDLAGGSFNSAASNVSADGAVVVGSGMSEVGQEAVRWENGTIEGLGDLAGGDTLSVASGVSADGSVVVGYGSSEGGFEAFRWEDGVMEGLGFLGSDNVGSYAYGASVDGSVIVGQSVSEGSVEAIIWTEEAGMQSLKEFIEDEYGLDLTGWTLVVANDISHDGTVIVGGGINPDGNDEAWRAFLPFQVAEEASSDASTGVLSTPRPNPVSETFTFSVVVERGQKVAVEVFDVTGRQVQALYNGTLAAGASETLMFNASGLLPGVYVIRATGEDFIRTRRVTVVR